MSTAATARRIRLEYRFWRIRMGTRYLRLRWELELLAGDARFWQLTSALLGLAAVTLATALAVLP